MFDVSHFLPAFASGFALFAGALLTLFLLTVGHKERNTRAFALTGLCTAFWGLFGFLFDTTSTADLDFARIWKIGSQIFTPAIAAAVSNFALVYYEETTEGTAPRAYRIGRAVMIVTAVLLDLLLISDLFGFSSVLVKEVVLGAKNLLEPIPGPFFHGVYAHFFLGALYTAYVVSSVLKKNASLMVKSQVRWIVSSLMIAMVAGGTRFATWYHFPISPNIAAFAAPVFGIGITYAITKHKLFNTKVIGAEIFTFSIWAFIFFLIVFSDTTLHRVVNTILFLATVILGTFLIRGTLHEAGQKEELEKANNALKNLNQNLEEIVRERTGELNRAKLHTDAIIENLVLGLIEYGNNFTILRVNRAAEELLGFKREQVVGKKITGDDVINKDLSSLAEVLFFDTPEKTIPSKEPRESLSELSVSHPISRELQIITFSVASEEEVLGKENRQFVKIIRDITREKLIDKNKSDFITIVAHQLRTPLSAIKWVFNMTLEKEAALSKEHVEAFKGGSQATERMIHLINDLLNVVNIEDGRFGYEFKSEDIIKTIAEVVADMKTRANWKNISLEVDFPNEPILPFVFDPGRISLALTSIVENAITYTQDGGSVRVTMKKNGTMLNIIVKDNGVGIPRDDIPKVMVTKFFRSIKALRTQTDGSGLGLFIAHNIIQSHRGNITIESEENKGTTVTISIPMTLTQNDAPKSRPQVQVSGGV